MTKYEELIKYSNPSRVYKNALDYFGRAVPLYMSDKPNKKYMIRRPDGKYVHFGEMGFQDYTRHLDKDRRDRYLARATKIKGNWKNDLYSANLLAQNLLWK
jgi:hypothetical protein